MARRGCQGRNLQSWSVQLPPAKEIDALLRDHSELGRPDLSFFHAQPWKQMTAADLGRAALVPTMLQFDEQAYYVALTRDWARGDGAIVDLGAFAAGSTACLAEGVGQAGQRQVVHGYDKFVVGDLAVFRTVTAPIARARPP